MTSDIVCWWQVYQCVEESWRGRIEGLPPPPTYCDLLFWNVRVPKISFLKHSETVFNLSHFNEKVYLILDWIFTPVGKHCFRKKRNEYLNKHPPKRDDFTIWDGFKYPFIAARLFICNEKIISCAAEKLHYSNTAIT